MFDPSRRADRSVLLALVAVLLLLPAPVLRLGLVDDDERILGAVHSAGFSLLDALPSGRGSYFRPVTMASLAAGERILPATRSAALQHGVGLVLFALCGVVAALLARRTARGAAPLPICAALAGLALVHPANVANVAWISARGDLLVMLFTALALLLADGAVRDGGVARFVAAGACAALAAGSKESGAVAPLLFAVAVTADWPELTAEARRRAVALLGVFAAISAAFVASVAIRFGGRPSVPLRLREAGEALLAIPAGLFLPNRSGALSELHREYRWLAVAAALLVAVGVAAAVFFARRRGRPALRLLLPVVAAIPAIAAGASGSRALGLPLLLLAATLPAVLPPMRRPAAAVVLSLGALFALVFTFDLRARISAERLRDSLCGEYRALLEADPALRSRLLSGAPQLLAPSPAFAGEAPVFANESASVLFRCATGTFGAFAGLEEAGELVTVARGLPAERLVDVNAEQGQLRLALRSGGAFFSVPPADATAVTARRRDGRAIELRRDDLRRFALVVTFDGERLAAFDPARRGLIPRP